jgi:hypothetical protein
MKESLKTPKVFLSYTENMPKNSNLHGDYANNILSYSPYTLIDTNFSIYRRLLDPKKMMLDHHFAKVGKKKPSTNTEPINKGKERVIISKDIHHKLTFIFSSRYFTNLDYF